MNDKLKVESFSTIILYGYLVMILKSTLIGFVASVYDKPDIMGILFLGIAIPVLFSLWNCVFMNYLARQDKQKLYAFNIYQFIIKATFMSFMTYVGVVWFGLPTLAYVFTLCGTWFMFHIIEAFYSQQLIMEL